MHLIILLLISIIFCTPSFAQQKDKVFELQDEVFFLQHELTQLKQALTEKDEAFKNMVLEKEALSAKVSRLQHSLVDRDADLPRLMEQAKAACRSQIDAVSNDLKAERLKLEKKDDQLGAFEKERNAWGVKMDMLTGEKISLRQSLKTVADQVDVFKREISGIKRDADQRLVQAQAATVAAVSDLKARFSSEQAKVQEKILMARKPLEEKIVVLQGQLKERDVACGQQVAGVKEAANENIRQLEQQITILRASAGQEIKKAQDAAAADVRRIRDELTVCRSEKK
ncbi:MAG: hypothetical protein V2A70_04965 [Candidatus Omnitrophota bacterium]